MTYAQLMKNVVSTGAIPEGEAVLVTQDSRKVVPGAVFVCVKGRTSDGHDFAKKALEQGAGMVVTERRLHLPHEVVVEDARAAFAELCAAYFGYPAKKLTLIGVTGTNGKTTVSSVLKQVLTQCGVRCGLIGTIRSEIGEMLVPARFTTPEAWDLQALFARMVAAGCTHVVMEASSQALEQGRLLGLRFALGVFTNLSRDHLDYHGDMENYFAAKQLLFAHSDAVLANADDTWAQRALADADCKTKLTFSAAGKAADYRAEDISLAAGGVDFLLVHAEQRAQVHFAMPGGYSVENALAVAGAAGALGYDVDKVAACLSHVQGVPGRCEVLCDDKFTVICDFAHTGDAMDKLLSALHPFVKNKMVVLFGCAGQRDKSKRVAMAQAAIEYGDIIYLTADNPREETFASTIAEVQQPLKESERHLVIEEDRSQAVVQALNALEPGDMLVLCGKGHEDYQALDGYSVYLNERQIVKEWLHSQGMKTEVTG